MYILLSFTLQYYHGQDQRQVQLAKVTFLNFVASSVSPYLSRWWLLWPWLRLKGRDKGPIRSKVFCALFLGLRSYLKKLAFRLRQRSSSRPQWKSLFDKDFEILKLLTSKLRWHWMLNFPLIPIPNWKKGFHIQKKPIWLDLNVMIKDIFFPFPE